MNRTGLDADSADGNVSASIEHDCILLSEDEFEQMRLYGRRLLDLTTELYSGLTRMGLCAGVRVHGCGNRSCPNNGEDGCRLGNALLEAERMGIEVRV